MRFSRYVWHASVTSEVSGLAFFLTVTSANGDGEIRTLDPLLARQVLSQLSYTPIFISNTGCWSSLFRQSLYSFVSFHLLISWELSSGLKWTRTTDLTLIRRAL